MKNLCKAIILTTITVGMTTPVYAKTNLQVIARSAISNNTTESNKAIANLRQLKQEGITAFLDTYKKEFTPKNPNFAKLNKTLDAICQQRDCYSSQLFWHTDLEQAKLVAKQTGKPILSLRLLGRLDQDLSCANSRFFRVALYPNEQISKTLREKFVLHWESVRPVPKVTIDFGNGKKMERTLTGNSIHYILDADGTPVDGLPGLSSPQFFQNWLTESQSLVKDYSSLQGRVKSNFLRQYHNDKLGIINTNWQGDLAKLNITLPPTNNTNSTLPTAAEAAPIAVSKMAIELPVINRIFLRDRQILADGTSEKMWDQIGELHRKEVTLDENTKALIKRKNPQINLSNVVENFEKLIAIDTTRNQYLLHSKIHEWFMNGSRNTTNVKTLNDQVYAELFLTPNSDPWLGLLPSNGYTAIDDDGIK
ncbi:MAG TPA: hypothetical protein V6C58_09290 [Allocoleopsis sp.]